MKKKQQFASDNYSGICPEAMNYFQKANKFHDYAYGEDEWTERATNQFRDIFGTDCEVFFVFNGTAANSLALSSLCQSYHSIVCHELAHIETDECGAPEFYSNGAKILLGSGINGKLHPEEIEKIITKRQDIHYPKPKVISITQATELGTVYSINELEDLKIIAEKYNLRIHMDGARFANAIVTLKCHPSEITWKTGVDVLCFGGIKNGLAVGEAVVFFNKTLAEEFDYRCKQAGQLSSKMRFIAAPWIGLLEKGTWLKNAQKANAMAAELERQLKQFDNIRFMFPRQANSVFIEIPEKIMNALKNEGWHFYTFIGLGGARLMCNWDTKKETVDEFIHDLSKMMSE